MWLVEWSRMRALAYFSFVVFVVSSVALAED